MSSFPYQVEFSRTIGRVSPRQVEIYTLLVEFNPLFVEFTPLFVKFTPLCRVCEGKKHAQKKFAKKKKKKDVYKKNHVQKKKKKTFRVLEDPWMCIGLTSKLI